METSKEFKSILCGKQICSYTNYENLIQDACGVTSDQLMIWRLILEEYSPKPIYIEVIHKTVANPIIRLQYIPQLNTIKDNLILSIN